MCVYVCECLAGRKGVKKELCEVVKVMVSSKTAIFYLIPIINDLFSKLM